jgi:hypothetical protein
LTSPIPTDMGGGWAAHTALGEDCFLCGQALADPAVHWMGATAEIYLHPDCVTELAIALFRDLSELKQLQKRETRQGALP